MSSLISKEFDSEPVYGDNDKDIKTIIKSYKHNHNTKRKCIIQMPFIGNSRFCYQSKQKVLSPNALGRM